MRTSQLVARLARQSNLPKAKAADQVDSLVTDLLRRLRRGQSVDLPGLGTLMPGLDGIRFESEKKKRDAREL